MSRANECAYPIHPDMPTPVNFGDPTGLTIREAFAMAAMQGILSSLTDAGIDEKLTATLAVIQADALIAELAKVKP